MNEAVASVVRLERRVMWRKRLLSLQAGLVLAATIGDLIAAVLLLVARLRPIGALSWANRASRPLIL